MQVIKRGDLLIPDPSPLLKQKIEEACTIPNPLYHRLLRMGNHRALYAVPKDFKFHSSSPEGLRCPVGLLPNIQKFADYYKIELNIEEFSPLINHIPTLSSYTPRPEQIGVVEEIMQYQLGTVVLPTGFGKSLIAVELANRLGLNTLILVPRTDLKTQFEHHLKTQFKKRPPIKVATYQSLYRDHSIVEKLADEVGTLIVDECHMAVSPKMRRILQTLRPKYTYGFTATPDRSDGLGKAIHLFFGPTIIERKLSVPPPTVLEVKHDGHIPMGEYGMIIECQTTLHTRNELIVKAVQDLPKNRNPIILVKRIEHALTLALMLPEAQIISSKLSKKKREALYQSLKESTRKPILIGTFSLLSTGIDLPFLDTLVIAGDLKSSVLQRQSAGRILRLFSNKQPPLIVDIHDTNNPILHHQFRERKKLYDKLLWTISTGDSSGTSKS